MLSLNKKEIALIIDELKSFILKAKIEQIIKLEPLVYQFTLYTIDKQKHRLLISIKKRELRIHLTTAKYKKVKNQNSPLILFSKKHIKDGLLLDINLLNEDRIIELSIVQNNIQRYLVVELFEARANIYVLNKSREISYSLFSENELNKVGSVYSFPKPSTYKVKSFIAKEKNKLYNQTIEEHFLRLISQRDYKNRYKFIITALKKKIKKRQETINKINIQIDKTKEWEDWQRKGELLKSSIHLIKQQQLSVRVINYFDSDLSYINIALDKNKSPRENIEVFFNKSKQFKKASKHLYNRIEKEKRTLCELEAMYKDFRSLGDEYNIDIAQSFDELLDKYDNNLLTAKELSSISIAYGSTSKRSDIVTKSKTRNKDYIIFPISCGKTAYVGRNARSNDKLSFSKARGNDLWLHTRDTAGSHVVVPLLKGESIREEWLIDAALLALAYSKSSGEAEVMYTMRKFISKAKGLAPGKVYVSSFKTIFVRYDEKRMQDIKDRGKV